MSETDTATRVLDILGDLNDRGAGAWAEFVYTLPEYDAEKTRTLYQGVGGAFVALGTIFRYDVEESAWIFQDFGGSETHMP